MHSQILILNYLFKKKVKNVYNGNFFQLDLLIYRVHFYFKRSLFKWSCLRFSFTLCVFIIFSFLGKEIFLKKCAQLTMARTMTSTITWRSGKFFNICESLTQQCILSECTSFLMILSYLIIITFCIHASHPHIIFHLKNYIYADMRMQEMWFTIIFFFFFIIIFIYGFIVKFIIFSYFIYCDNEINNNLCIIIVFDIIIIGTQVSYYYFLLLHLPSSHPFVKYIFSHF